MSKKQEATAAAIGGVVIAETILSRKEECDELSNQLQHRGAP